jgi:chorismate mutase
VLGLLILKNGRSLATSNASTRATAEEAATIRQRLSELAEREQRILASRTASSPARDDAEIARLNALWTDTAALDVRRQALRFLAILDYADFLASLPLDDVAKERVLDLLTKREQLAAFASKYRSAGSEAPHDFREREMSLRSELLRELGPSGEARLADYSATVGWRRNVSHYEEHLRDIGAALSVAQRERLVALCATHPLPNGGDFSLPEGALTDVARENLLSQEQFDAFMKMQRLQYSLAELARLRGSR